MAISLKPPKVGAIRQRVLLVFVYLFLQVRNLSKNSDKPQKNT